MASQAFSQKLNAFKSKCQQVLGPKRQGYGELSQLEQPLVSGQGHDSNDAYLRAHGVPRPGGGGGLATGGRVAQYGGTTGVEGDIGTLQTRELQDLIDLGKDASDILWEMAALQEEDKPGTKDIIDNVKLLQARLRGMVSDYKEGDEQTLAQALEVFDRLSTSLEEYEKSVLSPRSQQAPQAFAPSAQTPASIQPPARYQPNPYQPGNSQTAPGTKAPAEEAPLISFD